MLALMNNPQYYSYLRGSEPLNKDVTDIRETSKLLSGETSLLCDNPPFSLYQL